MPLLPHSESPASCAHFPGHTATGIHRAVRFEDFKEKDLTLLRRGSRDGFDGATFTTTATGVRTL
jgi:hypothetical protein